MEKTYSKVFKAATHNMSQCYRDVEPQSLSDILGATKVTCNSLVSEFGPQYYGFKAIKRAGYKLGENLMYDTFSPTEEVVTIVKDRYELLQHQQLVYNVIKVLEKNHINYSIPKVYVDQRPRRNRLYMNISLDDIKIDVDGSDITPTIDLYNSTDATLSCGIIFGAYRAKCENGMMIGETYEMTRIIHTPLLFTKLNFNLIYDDVMKKFGDLAEAIQKMQTVYINENHLQQLQKMGFNSMFVKHYNDIEESYMLNNNESVNKNTLWGLYSTATNFLTNYLMKKDFISAMNQQRVLYQFQNKILEEAA